MQRKKKLMSGAVVLLAMMVLASCQALDYSPFDLLQTPAGRSSLTAPSTIEPAPVATAVAVSTETVCSVNVPEALNLRSGPGTRYGVTHWLKPGELLMILNEPARGDWIRVATADNQRGWVNGRYCASIGGKP